MHKIFKATFHLKRDKEEQPRFITIEQNSKTRWFEFWFAAPLDSEQELITGTHRNFNECFEEALITLDACFPAKETA